MNNIDDLIYDILGKMKYVDFPQNAQADWEGTNHFEIHNHDGENTYFWLDCWDAMCSGDTWNPNPHSNRLGIVLEMACVVRPLINEIRRLREELNGGSE